MHDLFHVRHFHCYHFPHIIFSHIISYFLMTLGLIYNITYKLQDYSWISTYIIGLNDKIKQNHWRLWASIFPGPRKLAAQNIHCAPRRPNLFSKGKVPLLTSLMYSISTWIFKWASWWCHRLTICHICYTWNSENSHFFPYRGKSIS